MSLQLDKRTARAVAGGHPWVWPDALSASRREPAAGEEVILLDAVGGFLARGLADGPEGTGPAIRVISRDEREPPVGKLLFRRVAAARQLRQRCVGPDTSGYRLLHGEGDGLPGLVVDRYDSLLVVRPDSRAWAPHLRAVTEALRSEGGAGVRWILHRPKAGDPAPLHGGLPPEVVRFREEGREYLIRPQIGQKTGFFLDQRPTRSAVQALCRPGDQTLNLFSYTGGFSVAMALGGAERVVSVDLARAIGEDGKRCFELNGLDPKAHSFLAEDIFEWLPAVRHQRKGAFDLVVCDPPALARRSKDLPNARRAYRRLHEGIAPLLRPRALLVTCSCTARLGHAELLEDAVAGLAAGGRQVTRVLSRSGAGPDHPVPPGFPEGEYLTCLTLSVD